MKYEFLDHTADIKIRAYGKTKEEAYAHLVEAFAEHVAKGERVTTQKAKTVELEEDDQKSLLYNFLDELIYLLDAERFLAAKATITIEGNTLSANLFGDETTHFESLDYIKAATYAEMEINETKDECVIQVVLDV